MGEAVPIERVNCPYMLGDPRKSHGAMASLRQVPLKLAWSMTSHKVMSTIKMMAVYLVVLYLH